MRAIFVSRNISYGFGIPLGHSVIEKLNEYSQRCNVPVIYRYKMKKQYVRVSWMDYVTNDTWRN